MIKNVRSFEKDKISLSHIEWENTRDGKKLSRSHSMETTGHELLRNKIKLETGRRSVLDMFL